MVFDCICGLYEMFLGWKAILFHVGDRQRSTVDSLQACITKLWQCTLFCLICTHDSEERFTLLGLSSHPSHDGQAESKKIR